MKPLLAAAVALAAIAAAPLDARAIDLFCNPQDLCATVPRDGLGNPDYNHTDPGKPWVIGKTDYISLPAGSYTPGNGPFNAPMVYLVEDGVLAIEDLAAGAEVSIGAWFILCDRSQLRVTRSLFRSAAQYPFQYPIIADGNSAVILQEATLATLDKSLAQAAAPGALLHVMGGSSTLTAVPVVKNGVKFERVGEAWELAVVHQATATVHKADVFGEFYVAGDATFTVEDSQYFDLFFEACPGAPLAIPSLPGLCTIGSGANQCVTAGHQPTDFSLGPPDTSFTLSFKNDKIFSWAASTYAGSDLTVGAAPEDANFCVGLSMTGDRTLKLNPGSPPVAEGLDDRAIAFNGTHVFGWHVWPYGSGTVEILAGSEVGDFVAPDQVVGIARGTTFNNGMLVAQNDGVMHVEDCTVKERFQNVEAKVTAARTTFESSFSLSGDTWLADCTRPAQGLEDIRPAARIHEVALTKPADGASITGGALEIEGTVRAVDGSGAALSPFPHWAAEIRGDKNSAAHTGDTPVEGPIASLDVSAFPYGEYEVRLYFTDTVGQEAASVRKVTVGTPDAGQPDAGVDAGAEEDAGAPVDAGAIADAGAPLDAGAKADAAAEATGGGEGGCSCATISL